jgi:5-methylcytosine-specific restriction endonuclease McrA
VKFCKQCSHVKHPDQFRNHKANKDGKNTICRICSAYNAAEYKAKHRRADSRSKIYVPVLLARALDNEAYRIRVAQAQALQQLEDTATAAGWAYLENDIRGRITVRDDCIRRSRALWATCNTGRLATVESRRAYRNAQYRRRDYINSIARSRNYRARKRNAIIVPFTAMQLKDKCAYYGNKCWVCGNEYQAIDHVKPLAKGGSHMLANLRPICTPCNSNKRDTWPYAK